MIAEIANAFSRGDVIPYLGPAIAALDQSAPPPSSPEALAPKLTNAVTVPHKIRNNVTAAAQYIENFKHRKTLSDLMSKAFATDTAPSAFHLWLAAQPNLPLVVHAWYDNLCSSALQSRTNWGLVQGVSQAEHFGVWVNYFRPDGSLVAGKPFTPDGSGAKAPAEAPDETLNWSTLLYEPLGAVWPAANYIASDSDYVEVLTEIDIQTPIPETVQHIRRGRSFLFLGCRFATQLERSFARQIMKRSSDRHWAVFEGPLSKNEEKFLAEQNIQRVDASLPEFLAALSGTIPAIVEAA